MGLENSDKRLQAKKGQQNRANGQDICHESKDENSISQCHEQTNSFKIITFMRHGRIGFSYYKTNIYFAIHTLLNGLRKFANRHSLLKKSMLHKMLAKLIKSVKKALYWLIESDADYGNLNYRQFMRFLLNEIDPPLAKWSNGINIENIPNAIDVIYHSSALRSIQSAKYIRKLLRNQDKQIRVEDRLAKELDEVKFSKDILSKDDFKMHRGLKRVRGIVLKKWYCGINKAETFDDSISRIEKMCVFLKNTPDRNILLVTHGWYLRLLYMYFKNQEKSYRNLKSRKCIFKYAESFQIRLRQDFVPHSSFSKSNKDGDIKPPLPSSSIATPATSSH